MSNSTDKELDRIIAKYTEAIKDLAHYVFTENKIPETLELPDGLNLKQAIEAYVNNAVVAEYEVIQLMPRQKHPIPNSVGFTECISTAHIAYRLRELTKKGHNSGKDN